MKLLQDTFGRPIAELITSYYSTLKNEHADVACSGVFERCFDDRGRPLIGWNDLFLHVCMKGYLPFIKLLLQRPVDPDKWIFLGFVNAANFNRLDIVEYMITQALRVPSVIGLYVACRNGHYDIVRVILSYPISMTDEINHQPITTCELVRQMIIHGIKPLDICLSVSCGKNYHKIVEMLLNHGATKCLCGLDVAAHRAKVTQASSRN